MGWGLKGDLFIRIPLIEALKERFPQARITVVVDPGNVIVLANHPAVDHVFPFGRKKKPLYRYMFHAIRNALLLRRQRFDLSLDLYAVHGTGGVHARVPRYAVDGGIMLGHDGRCASDEGRCRCGH